MRKTLYAISRALYRPIVPEVQYSQDQYEACLRRATSTAARWLDLGCGHQLLPEWRRAAELELVARSPFVVGLDYDLPSLSRHSSFGHRVRGDASSLPFPDQTFDLVTANMVVEHLTDPVTQFREVARVLRPRGLFLFHTPNARSYLAATARWFPDVMKRMAARVLEGRVGEDVFPTHYLANDDAAIRRTATEAGLDVDAVDLISSTPLLDAVPVLSMVEAAVLRQLIRRQSLAQYRTNIIGWLRKPAAVPERRASLDGGGG